MDPKNIKPRHLCAFESIFQEIVAERNNAAPADFECAKKAIHNLYELNGYAPPKYIYHAQSPIEARIVIQNLIKTPETDLREIFWKKFYTNLRCDGLRFDDYMDYFDEDFIGNNDDIECQDEELAISILSSYVIGIARKIGIDSHSFPEVGIANVFADEAEFRNISMRVFDNLSEDLGIYSLSLPSHKFRNTYNYSGEYFRVFWENDFIWISYARALEMGFSETDCLKIDAICEIARCCGASYLYKDLAVICDRPIRVNIVNNRFHDDEEAAILFSDNSCVYLYNDINVPKFVITNPQEICSSKIFRERNLEVRRTMIERMGSMNFLAQCDAIIIHQDIDQLGNPRRLFKVNMDEGDWYAIEVTDSSKTLDNAGNWVNRKYVLSINPEHYDGRAGHECQAAIASTWRYGNDASRLFFDKPEDYVLAVET
ncbi:MAG: hypothetical protein J0L55_13715 [Caulobacterales bacterium]|nr:hypothetical protein [Caulobacterales bacterium]